MALANCEVCNKIFNKVSSCLCPACIERYENDLKIVTEALREEPNQKIDELSERTGVSKKTILRLLKDQRITSDANLVDMKCGKCGAPAVSVSIKLCQRCAAEMSKVAAQVCRNVARAYGHAPRKEGAEEPEGRETVHETLQRKTGRGE